MPERIARLPLDARGYPIPWFVAYLPNGEPEFRAMDPKKWKRAITEHRCWVCGEYTGAYLAFVIGPMCGINRTTTEPACHLQCAEWSVVNCPFLARPHMVRRGEQEEWIQQSRERCAGTMIPRNPGVTCIWVAKSYSIFRDPKGKPLIHLATPVEVTFWSSGRKATREEVLASVDSGYPLLQAEAEKERHLGAVEELAKMRQRFEQLLPAALVTS
jgi:hypothetical protein